MSAIGGDYSEVIYENVLNYLDNASNVDLCKVKALQSMIEVVGLKYDVLDTFKSIPVEVANLIDILSINKSYLLKSTVFCSAFIDQLSSTGCISSSAYPSELSNEIDISAWQNEGREISASCTLVDGTAYKSFLENLFADVLKKYVYLQYADAESGKLSTTHDFIYQYI